MVPKDKEFITYIINRDHIICGLHLDVDGKVRQKDPEIHFRDLVQLR
jgi:hypothetical protein